MNPASLAVPAGIASAAYLNARWSLPNDFHLSFSVARARIHANRMLKRDRVNNFYRLEEHAHNKSIRDEPFLIYESKAWTFKQTYDIVLRYAGWLHESHHVTAGEVVAIDSTNKPSFLFLSLALWSLGALPAFINFNLVGEALLHSIRASTARVLIIDSEIRHRFSPEVVNTLSASTFRKGSLPLSLVIFDRETDSSLNYFPPYRAPDSVRSVARLRDSGVLIFTSGTTNLPKPAIVPWERLCVGGSFTSRWLGLRSVKSKQPDRFYTSMPLYHSSAFVLGFGPCLNNATTLVLGHQFSTRKFWSEVRASKATVIQYVGETLRYLMTNPPDRDLDQANSVRLAFGNGLRPDVWEAFKVRFDVPIVAEFYAATEGVSGSFNLSSNSFSSGAIGRYGIIGDLVLKSANAIVKVDWETEEPHRDPMTGYCERLTYDQPGELICRLDAKDISSTYVGYFGNDTASAKKILRNVFSKDDAWFRTGDTVKYDRHGLLWFSDRIGDTYRWKSENVSTAEVAQVLGMHPMVQEANVYGVELPGYEGRAGCAAVLLADGAFAADAEPAKDILESIATFATNSLPRYGVPVFLRVVKELQMTGNNKQQKVELRKQGADPSLVGEKGDRLYWLRPGTSAYERFDGAEWEALKQGRAKL